MQTSLHGCKYHLWSLYGAAEHCIFMTSVPLWFLYCAGIAAWLQERWRPGPQTLFTTKLFLRDTQPWYGTGGMQEFNNMRNFVILQKEWGPLLDRFTCVLEHWSSPFWKWLQEQMVQQQQKGQMSNMWKFQNEECCRGWFVGAVVAVVLTCWLLCLVSKQSDLPVGLG